MLISLLRLVHTADADKIVSSHKGVNWVGDSRREFSAVLDILETEQFCPVSSAVWTHLWTILDPVSKYDVTVGNRDVNTREIWIPGPELNFPGPVRVPTPELLVRP